MSAAPPAPVTPGPNYVLKGYGHVLTYSQCHATEAGARLFLFKALDVVQRVLGLRDGADKVTGGVEEHEDGRFHVHIGLVRVDSKAVKIGRRLDVDGVHPNVSAHRFTTPSLRAALAYPLKEDEEGYCNFDEDIEDLFDPLPGRSASTATAERANAWKAALDAPSYEDALEMLRQDEPREFIINHDKIVSFFKNYFAPVYTPKFKAEDFTEPPIQWDDVPERNSVVIVGPPNTGKTQYAIAQLGENPFFASHVDILRQFNPAIHTGILLDEVSTKQWPPTAFISLLDREMPRDIHVRYATVRIPAGTKKIICVNSLDSIIPASADQDTLDAIHDRMTVIRVVSRLF